MRINVFASGSGGNCMLLSDRGTNILIDAGISMKRISTALASMELTLRDIGGVLVTHEHSDHIMGLKMLAKHSGIPIYAPHTVANRLRGCMPETEDALRIIPVGEGFEIEDLTVTAFHTPHDTDESVGYRIEGSSVFAIATDMGHVTPEIEAGLRGAQTVLIESNHDETMLRYGPYPAQLKRRILSDNGHLSNENCAALAYRLASSGTANIILGHLSRENNRPDLAMDCALAATAGTGAKLYCAPVLGNLCIDMEELCLT